MCTLNKVYSGFGILPWELYVWQASYSNLSTWELYVWQAYQSNLSDTELYVW